MPDPVREMRDLTVKIPHMVRIWGEFRFDADKFVAFADVATRVPFRSTFLPVIEGMD